MRLVEKESRFRGSASYNIVVLFLLACISISKSASLLTLSCKNIFLKFMHLTHATSLKDVCTCHPM